MTRAPTGTFNVSRPNPLSICLRKSGDAEDVKHRDRGRWKRVESITISIHENVSELFESSRGVVSSPSDTGETRTWTLGGSSRVSTDW